MEILLSPNFKKMTFNAIFAIITFILVYLLLLLLGIALTVACIYGGIMLIITIPKFITIILGIGLASLGIMVFIFLVKFLFKTHSVDRSHLVEISEKDYPQLFSMIEDIACEAETKFPKKVYLSGEVNAAVFYDSNFWSMFFPIRKNLLIGMGLVNTVTEQELKAVLAHEFGHFSQRSMSVGSYVYNVNQVIFNMLYDNESFDKMIQAWAGLTGYFSIFVLIAVKIINGIQWILQKMYGFVNVRHMALSREMEFHADQVAANIAGSKPLEDSLLRLDLSQQAYNWVLNFYNKKVQDNIISKNIYKEQLFSLELLAKENEYPLKNNLPVISISDMNRYNKSKINIEDQWASHPTTGERVAALQKLNIVKQSNRDNPAIDLFPNADKIEEELTKQVFYYMAFKSETIVMDFAGFQKEFSGNIEKNRFPDEYNDYYDNKNPVLFDVENITTADQTGNIESLFDRDKVDLVYKSLALENDKNILNAIANKSIAVKTFDYDGQKYKRKDAVNLIFEIDKELRKTAKEIEDNDIDIYRYFYSLAMKRGVENELKSLYITLFDEDKNYEYRIGIYNKFAELANALQMARDDSQVEGIFREISHLEVDLRKELRLFIENPVFAEEITKAMKDNFDKYLSRDWSYSKNNISDQEYLETLFTSINDYYTLALRSFFIAKLNLLNYQAGLLNS
ncbi:Zn-dependent protease with chaperone function [Dysgonomonas hofstadii]|uniref:Zn-dependent protease with chaperone function n=1 Tax=Dysgonomonas hofstadii TaxID=637886 RepID=A0A840CTN0_9BACT|nr:M48 family metallopeptidase [Dysgonomonas hofstadii]MBB4035872.1 Zn-dependent protease with chaperone function [Dysgonomonas hofstadii]